MSRVKNKIIDSEFSKNVIKLITGLSIAQLIPILVTPILTQFFSPEQFGTYGLYVSIYTILGVISSGKYDMAIMLPKNKKDSINIIAICFIFAIFFSLIIFFLLLIFKDLLFESNQLNLFKTYYWIIPFSILLFALLVISIGWICLLITEPEINPIFLLFEQTSAFSTVGMSTGNTTQELSNLGQCIIITTMFVGRIGTLLMAFSLIQKKKKSNYNYPKAHLMIG